MCCTVFAQPAAVYLLRTTRQNFYFRKNVRADLPAIGCPHPQQPQARHIDLETPKSTQRRRILLNARGLASPTVSPSRRNRSTFFEAS